MANITPQMVKDLREKTGAGMGDCKSALTDANGDMQQAIEVLRKKGAASVAKRSDRSANEGIILIETINDGKTSIAVEVNCETDFVARNELFEKFVHQVADVLKTNNADTLEQLFAIKVGNDTIEGMFNEILAKFSEKITVKRHNKFHTEGFFTDYIHAGNKLGVIIEANIANPTEEIVKHIRDIAMQIAAMNPMFIDRSQVKQDQIAKEIEIYKEAAITEGKKPEIADRIAQGKLEKFYQEQCLIEQQFVKDSSKTIKDVLAEVSKLAGTDVKILSFHRFFLGEN